jgi:hypothetical protein
VLHLTAPLSLFPVAPCASVPHTSVAGRQVSSSFGRRRRTLLSIRSLSRPVATNGAACKGGSAMSKSRIEAAVSKHHIRKRPTKVSQVPPDILDRAVRPVKASRKYVFESFTQADWDEVRDHLPLEYRWLSNEQLTRQACNRRKVGRTPRWPRGIRPHAGRRSRESSDHTGQATPAWRNSASPLTSWAALPRPSHSACRLV